MNTSIEGALYMHDYWDKFLYNFCKVDRLNFDAIARIDKWMATPLEISSRSERAKAKLERILFGGRIPPVRPKMRAIDGWCRSKRLAIECKVSPFSHRSDIRDFCFSL